MVKRKRKKKSSKRKFSIPQLIATVLFVVTIFVFSQYNKRTRDKKLNELGFNTIAIVEKTKRNASKGTTGTKDLVYFYFVKNDTVFHKISDLHSGTINRFDINVGDAFPVRVVRDDYDIKKVDYSVKLDTFIDKGKYKIQRYNTLIHKNIIE